MTSLYHNPFHHHDPTIISVHTLLKPQAYQNPPSINTDISPPPTYPNSIANNSPHYLIRHIDYATQQLLHSQRACLHSISNFASEISALNNSLTPPNFTYQQPPFIASTTMFNHNFNQHSHDPFPPPKSTPFNHHNFTYNTTTYFNNQPVNPQTFVSPSISTSTVTPTVFTPPPLEICTHPYKPPATSQILPYNSNHVTTEIDAAKKLVPDLSTLSDSAPVSEVVGEQHVAIGEDFNDVASSQLIPNFTADFSTPETDERSSEDDVTVKDQEEVNHRLTPSIPPPRYDSNCVTPFTIKSFGDVSKSLVLAKHRPIFPTRPLLLPYRFTVVTNNDNTHSGATKRQVLNHKLFVSNFESSFGFHVGCTFNFDPGGDKFSPAENSCVNRCIFSLLWVPWDRGKLWVSSFLFSATILFPVRDATSGSPRVPWGSKTSMNTLITVAAMHVKGRGCSKVRVNWELKSLKSSNDLMGSSPYLAQGALSHLAHAAKKNCILSKNLRISPLNTI